MNNNITQNFSIKLRKKNIFTQEKSPQIFSYGYTRDDVKLKWQSGDALDAAPWLTMQNFFMVGKKAGQFYEYYDSGDSYSNLEANFYFQRLSFYYVMQFFFPAGVIVLISCASLWVPQCYVTLRMGFGE